MDGHTELSGVVIQRMVLATSDVSQEAIWINILMFVFYVEID